MNLNPSRHHLPLAITLVLTAIALFHGPIHQPEGYHDFADQSLRFGIPHFCDVTSNIGFALVALWGGWHFAPASARMALGRSWPGYGLFLGALLLTSIGSTWYHLAPDNARLVWDRLPIALACAGLLAGVYSDVRGGDARLPAAILAVGAIASVAWWRLTDLAGNGDLRPYLLLQVLPLLLIPVWQWLYHADAADRRALGAAVALYVIAKILELNDHAVASMLGAVTGHTLKHLLAALAAFLIVARLVRRARAAAAVSDGAACPPARPSAKSACR